jgi:general secretion pathway protein D
MIQRLALLTLCLAASPVWGQDSTAVSQSNDSLDIRFVNADIRAVIRALGRYLSKPILVGNVSPNTVTLETPRPVPLSDVPAIIRALVTSHELAFEEDSTFYRVVPRTYFGGQAEPQPEMGRRQKPLRLFVIHLKHAQAADVAATVNLLFGGSGPFSGASGFTSGSLSDELRRGAVGGAREPREVSPEGRTSSSAELSGPIMIVPDELTNSLLVRAGSGDMDVIRQAVEQLDVRPLQVLIQVLIVEVRREEAREIGVESQADSAGLGGGALLSAFLFGAGGFGDLVVRVMNLSSYDIQATLHAAASSGTARIISRPVVVASNNREANILVGVQQPFVQVSRSLPTDTPTRDQVVQYRDVGTKLSVIPTINQDGYVSLLIRQEVSTATDETQFDAPVIATREVESTVLIRDGQTVVMGGLRERVDVSKKSGVPLLSELPIVGGLFGSHGTQTSETELFLFITPTVMRDDESAAAAAEAALEDAERAGVRRGDLKMRNP